MNLEVLVHAMSEEGDNELVDIVLRSMSSVWWEVRATLEGTAEECAKELVEMSQEEAGRVNRRQFIGGVTYNCLEVLPLAGLPSLRGDAPPSSRKLTETPAGPP